LLDQKQLVEIVEMLPGILGYTVGGEKWFNFEAI
jgi:hypothetical protein